MKHDLWRVKVAQAIVEMTLDEVVAAFQAGQIEKNTAVIAPGDFTWTTLGAVADLGDEDDNNNGEEVASPLSIAPLTSDVDFSIGEEATLLPPKKRRVGRTLGVVATYVVLIVVGAGAGAYRAAPGEVRAKVSAVQSKFSKKAAAPAAAPVVVVAAAPQAAPPAPAPVPTPVAAPVVVAAPEPTPSSVGTSIDNLPSAKQAAATKKIAPRRRSR